MRNRPDLVWPGALHVSDGSVSGAGGKGAGQEASRVDICPGVNARVGRAGSIGLVDVLAD
jgi:hypothetical protein